jgi:polysaccharide pyruvyl transferase WcaK-like protein
MFAVSASTEDPMSVVLVVGIRYHNLVLAVSEKIGMIY